MTSPVNVGEVSVDVVAESKALAKSIREKLESAFKGLDFTGLIQSAVGKVHVPVDVDTAAVGAGLHGQHVTVELEPDTATFATKLERALHGRKVKVELDVDRDTGISRLTSSLKGLAGALPSISGVSDGLSGMFASLQKVTGSSAQMGGALIGAAESATGPIGLVVGALAGVAAASAAVGTAIVGGVSVGISAITALAGAIAALPGLLAGVGAGAGTLLLGFKGIADAFKPASGGGGGGAAGQAANQARQIAAASRQVEAARRGITAANRGLEAAERSLSRAEDDLGKAQARARLAQLAVSQARIDAVDDIDDLNRALRSSRLSEEEAAQAVRDAALALSEARLTGNIADINRADLAYQRAQISLEDTRDASEDLQKQVDKTNQLGVDGTDRVQKALQDQASATDDVARAQDGLKSAQDGVLAAQDSLKSATDGLASAQDSLAAAQTKVAAGSAGVAKEVVKLAPAAQRFVDAIKALKSAFDDLRLDVQQRLFAGLDKTVTSVADRWIPALKTTLGSYADTFNGFFKGLGTAISTPKFITDMQAGAEGFRQLLDKLGESITSKLVPAFGALSKAAGPFLSKLGDELALVVTKFSQWILDGEKSGGLTTFFDKASEAMHDLFVTGTQVGRIIGSLFEIITGSQAPAGTVSPLDRFNAALTRVADWLADPANQAKVQSFILGIEQAVNKVLGAINTVSGWVDTVASWGDKFEAFKTRVGQIFDQVVGFFRALPDRTVTFIKELPGRVSAIFASMARRAGEIVGYGLGVVARFFYDLPGKISNFIKSIPDRVENLWKSVVSVAKSLPGRFAAGVDALRALPDRIKGYFNGLPGKLWSAGQDAIRGLWNGITSMGRWLRDRVYNFASGVIDGFKAGFDSHSPSKRMADEVGVTLPQGISVGIFAGRKNLLRDVNRLADDVVAAALPAMSGTSFNLGAETENVSHSLQASSTQQMQLSWKSSATGDQVLDAIAGLIDLRHNGDVQAAFSRT